MKLTPKISFRYSQITCSVLVGNKLYLHPLPEVFYSNSTDWQVKIMFICVQCQSPKFTWVFSAEGHSDYMDEQSALSQSTLHHVVVSQQVLPGMAPGLPALGTQYLGKLHRPEEGLYSLLLLSLFQTLRRYSPIFDGEFKRKGIR